MDTYTVFPADRGLSDAQYATLRELEEGRLTQADQQVGESTREEELLDLEALGLVKSHTLRTDAGDYSVWVVTPRGRHVLRSIGTYKLPPARPESSSSSSSGVPLAIVMLVAIVTGIVAVGIAAGWW